MVNSMLHWREKQIIREIIDDLRHTDRQCVNFFWVQNNDSNECWRCISGVVLDHLNNNLIEPVKLRHIEWDEIESGRAYNQFRKYNQSLIETISKDSFLAAYPDPEGMDKIDLMDMWKFPEIHIPSLPQNLFDRIIKDIKDRNPWNFVHQEVTDKEKKTVIHCLEQARIADDYRAFQTITYLNDNGVSFNTFANIFEWLVNQDDKGELPKAYENKWIACSTINLADYWL